MFPQRTRKDRFRSGRHTHHSKLAATSAMPVELDKLASPAQIQQAQPIPLPELHGPASQRSQYLRLHCTGYAVCTNYRIFPYLRCIGVPACAVISAGLTAPTPRSAFAAVPIPTLTARAESTNQSLLLTSLPQLHLLYGYIRARMAAELSCNLAVNACTSLQ